MHRLEGWKEKPGKRNATAESLGKEGDSERWDEGFGGGRVAMAATLAG